MEYMQNDMCRTAGADTKKMPFYMTYPMQNVFLDEMEYERDMERMKRMYPQEVRAIQECVEDECDKMEYEGSMMFDEHPDRLTLRQICSRICQKVAEPVDFEAEQYEDGSMEMEELKMVRSGRPSHGASGHSPYGASGRPPYGSHQGARHRWDSGLQNLVEVMLYNEMYQRRCRHRRCRRWW